MALILGIKKGRVCTLIQKRVFSVLSDMLIIGHFQAFNKTLNHIIKIKFGVYTAKTVAFFSSPEPKAHR